MSLKDFFYRPEGSEAQEFQDFTPFEYTLFWVLLVLIIVCTAYLVGGDLERCLEVFFRIMDPLNWR